MRESPQQILQNQVDTYKHILENLKTNKQSMDSDNYYQLFNQTLAKVMKFEKAIVILNQHYI
ncbi:MAG: hypothetical protein R2852_06165 [Bacteroidia bacterium]